MCIRDRLGAVVFADQGGHVAPGEDRRLAGGALRPAGQAQGGIGRDQRRSWRDNRPALGQEPVRAQQAGQVGQSRRSERVGRCLLYTSPSPRDRTRSRMPSSA